MFGFDISTVPSYDRIVNANRDRQTCTWIRQLAFVSLPTEVATALSHKGIRVMVILRCRACGDLRRQNLEFGNIDSNGSPGGVSQ
jgi:hypothetical protein